MIIREPATIEIQETRREDFYVCPKERPAPAIAMAPQIAMDPQMIQQLNNNQGNNN